MRSIFAACVGLVVNASAFGQVPPSYQLWEFGTMPRPAFKMVLLGVPVVQEELKLTAAQKQGMEETRTRLMAKAQEAIRGITDRAKMQATREAMFKELMPAILANLEPGQRDRLDQIQLQSQGPFAFNRSRNPQLVLEGPGLAERLKLSDDQIERIKAIAEEGEQEIGRAATVPIVLDSKAGRRPPSRSASWSRRPNSRRPRAKARADARKAWASVIQRIEQVLTEPQRKAYREMLGLPFDLSKIRFSDDETAEDAEMVAGGLNVGGGGGEAASGPTRTSTPRSPVRRTRQSTRGSSSTRPTTTSTRPTGGTSRSPR